LHIGLEYWNYFSLYHQNWLYYVADAFGHLTTISYFQETVGNVCNLSSQEKQLTIELEKGKRQL
jgi:hypothetical protein